MIFCDEMIRRTSCRKVEVTIIASNFTFFKNLTIILLDNKFHYFLLNVTLYQLNFTISLLDASCQ